MLLAEDIEGLAFGMVAGVGGFETSVPDRYALYPGAKLITGVVLE